MSREGESGLKLGVFLTHANALLGDRLENLIPVVRCLDASALDHLTLSDHVALGTSFDSYPALGVQFPFPPTEPYPDPLVTLGAIAAVTERITLVTGVLIAPLRPAVLLAKMAATVDVLAQGRFELGVGTGWQDVEFAALGVPMEGKAARMDDAIRASQALWSSPSASFSSDTVSFTDLSSEPRPWGPLPVWFAGKANKWTVDRVARLGAGWLPLGTPPLDELRQARHDLEEAFARHGRDRDGVGIRVTLGSGRNGDGKVSLEATVAQVGALRQAGVTQVAINARDFAENVDQLAEVVDEFCRLVK
jgi:probable F420-dependent oxidoreductase